MFGCCYCWHGKCVWKIDYRRLMEKLQDVKTQQTNKNKTKKNYYLLAHKKYPFGPSCQNEQYYNKYIILLLHELNGGLKLKSSN